MLVWQADKPQDAPGAVAGPRGRRLRRRRRGGSRAEWGGSFRSDLESYVSTAVIEACTEGYGVGMSQVPRHPPEASWHLYVHAS